VVQLLRWHLRRRPRLHRVRVGVRMRLELRGLEVYSKGIEVRSPLEVRLCIVRVYRLPRIELFL
jgi:hypothetical protein